MQWISVQFEQNPSRQSSTRPSHLSLTCRHRPLLGSRCDDKVDEIKAVKIAHSLVKGGAMLEQL